MRSRVLFRASQPSRCLAPQPSHFRRCFSQNAPASISGLLEWKPNQSVDNVAVNGFVRSVRAMKSHRFISLGDGSSVAPLQAVIPVSQAEGLSVGAAVRLTGSWVSSPGHNQSHELHVNEVEILGASDAMTFPIQKKYHTPEYLRTIPHLRSRTPYNAALLRLRSDAIASLNQFFANRLFTQTHPPIITSADCEGGGEAFTISPASKEGNEEPFFRSPKYLTVSTQLHLEALAQSVGNVWSLSPTFRAEKSDTSRHLSEFYMLEAELAFADELGSVMDVLEDMLRHLGNNLYHSKVVHELLTRPVPGGSDLARVEEVERRWEGLMTESWPRITYAEAIKILSSKAELFAHKPSWSVGLQSEHEKYLAAVVGDGKKPIFVTNYPREIKAFYMLQSPVAQAPNAATAAPGDDSSSTTTVECFDLLVPEFCEIAGGSMREHRLAPLLAAMKRQGIDQANPDLSSEEERGAAQGSLDWYVDLRRWGCPRHGGFGLGFDRLLCYLSGVQTVRDIVAFPRWFGRCDC